MRSLPQVQLTPGPLESSFQVRRKDKELPSRPPRRQFLGCKAARKVGQWSFRVHVNYRFRAGTAAPVYRLHSSRKLRGAPNRCGRTVCPCLTSHNATDNRAAGWVELVVGYENSPRPIRSGSSVCSPTYQNFHHGFISLRIVASASET